MKEALAKLLLQVLLLPIYLAAWLAFSLVFLSIIIASSLQLVWGTVKSIWRKK